MLKRVEVEVPCHLDIHLAILDDLVDLSQLVPFEGLESVGRLPNAECRTGHGFKLESVPQLFLEFNEHVEVVESSEVGVELGTLLLVRKAGTGENMVVKADMVEPHHKVGASTVFL
jgi:hypothetical protein